MREIEIIMLDESGQGIIEYGLILGLIAVVGVVALILLGPKTSALFSITEQALPEWITEQSSPACAGPAQ